MAYLPISPKPKKAEVIGNPLKGLRQVHTSTGSKACAGGMLALGPSNVTSTATTGSRGLTAGQCVVSKDSAGHVLITGLFKCLCKKKVSNFLT